MGGFEIRREALSSLKPVILSWGIVIQFDRLKITTPFPWKLQFSSLIPLHRLFDIINSCNSHRQAFQTQKLKTNLSWHFEMAELEIHQEVYCWNEQYIALIQVAQRGVSQALWGFLWKSYGNLQFKRILTGDFLELYQNIQFEVDEDILFDLTGGLWTAYYTGLIFCKALCKIWRVWLTPLCKLY